MAVSTFWYSVSRLSTSDFITAISCCVCIPPEERASRTDLASSACWSSRSRARSFGSALGANISVSFAQKLEKRSRASTLTGLKRQPVVAFARIAFVELHQDLNVIAVVVMDRSEVGRALIITGDFRAQALHDPKAIFHVARASSSLPCDNSMAAIMASVLASPRRKPMLRSSASACL